MSTISDVCLDFFDRGLRSSNGKPRPGQEWTVFSAIVIEQGDSPLKVVAAGTGSKCLGEGQLSAAGDLVHDSHAEVMAKRSFRRYLLEQAQVSLAREAENQRTSSKSDANAEGVKEELRQLDREKEPKPCKEIFEWCSSSRELRLRRDVRFHFFSTHPPCGDAAICERHNEDEADVDGETASKRPRLDLNRTGAKCVSGEAQDAHGPGLQFHTALGVLRTKPGRGDPTRSLSCSDKMLRWNALGWQGALLAAIIKDAVTMTSVTVCSRAEDQFSAHALQRALVLRLPEELRSQLRVDLVNSSGYAFHREPTLRACPTSISWSLTSTALMQVAVEGRKQGCAAKHLGTAKARLKICRLDLALSLMALASNPDFGDVLPPSVSSLERSVRYSQLKRLSVWYNQKRDSFMASVENWPSRDKALDQFIVQ